LYDIHDRCSNCPPFAATQALGASLQGEDADCGGVAAAYYGEVGTPVIDNAVKQWNSGVSAPMLVSLVSQFQHLL